MSSQAQISISKDAMHSQESCEISEAHHVSNKYHSFWAPVTLITSIIVGVVFWTVVAVYFWV